MIATRLRSDFPVLARTIDGVALTYLDSAATSLKPRSVLEAAGKYNEEVSANVHRGRHILSQEASIAYEDARRAVARFLGTSPDCIVFTRNATESLNLVARGLQIKPTDCILTDSSNHHSNLLPWFRAGHVELLSSDPLRSIDLDQLEDEIKRVRPRVLAICHASNVTGVIQPLREICSLARRYNVLTVIDAAQSAPHMRLDVEALGVDFLAFSGHKMLATTGIGVLYGTYEHLCNLEPLMVGGGTVDRTTAQGYTLKKPPYCFESGTPHISGAIALEAAIDYLEDVGFDALAASDEELASMLESELDGLPGCRLLMSHTKPRLAIASIAPLSDRFSVDHLAQALSDTHKVMVRSGFHCCQLLFDGLGLSRGSIRASGYLYNDSDDIRRFASGLRGMLERL